MCQNRYQSKTIVNHVMSGMGVNIWLLEKIIVYQCQISKLLCLMQKSSSLAQQHPFSHRMKLFRGFSSGFQIGAIACEKRKHARHQLALELSICIIYADKTYYFSTSI